MVVGQRPGDQRPRAGAPLPTVLEVFIPGHLRNPNNQGHGHWTKAHGYRKAWRSKTMLYVGSALAAGRFRWSPDQAKRITLLGHTHNPMDYDGLVAALKPVVDGLRDAGLIHDDSPRSGHEVIYTQRVNRQQRGVLITAAVRAEPPTRLASETAPAGGMAGSRPTGAGPRPSEISVRRRSPSDPPR